MKRIKKDDTVIVIAGRSRGHIGKVKRCYDDRVVVEGANIVKKHKKPNPQMQIEGGIISIEAAMHQSNVSLYNPNTQKADRVGFKYIEKDGRKHKVRYFKSNDELVDLI